MSGTSVNVWKFFWPDQDEQQEAWLREKARQGLHVRKVGFFLQWVFERGEPADIAYRIDFTDKSTPDARQLFVDAGWELAASVAGYQYWRKAAVDGKAPEIFTDVNSKLQKYKRVLALLVLCCVSLFVVMLMNDRFGMDMFTPFFNVMLAVNMVNVYQVLRLWRRIRQMQAASPAAC